MKPAKDLMAMSDEALMEMALQGEANSNILVVGSAAINMRSATRIAAAAANMATANRDLVETTKKVVEAHHGLIRETRYLVHATWGLVAMTLVCQLALIAFEFVTKK
jgi:hypothetical protein